MMAIPTMLAADGNNIIKIKHNNIMYLCPDVRNVVKSKRYGNIENELLCI